MLSLRPFRALIAATLLAVSYLPAARAITPEEFAALDPETALRLPVLEALNVFGWRREEFVFVLENALIDLRYLYRRPSGKPSQQLSEAIRTFQREAGYRPTGVLLVGEFMSLIQRGNEFWQAPIYPGPVLYLESEGRVMIEGTWEREQEAGADPIQSTSIRCFRAANLCTAVTARLRMAGEEDSWFHASAIELGMHAYDWTISQWDAQRIEAEDRSSLCVVQRLSIDLKRQTATLRNQPLDDERCRDGNPQVVSYRLQNGYEIATRYWQQRSTRALTLRSKAFQDLVKRVSRKPASK
jgi:hypothetical protein